MANCILWVFTTISSAVTWLYSFSYQGIPFLYYLIGLSITGIIMRYIF